MCRASGSALGDISSGRPRTHRQSHHRVRNPSVVCSEASDARLTGGLIHINAPLRPKRSICFIPLDVCSRLIRMVLLRSPRTTRASRCCSSSFAQPTSTRVTRSTRLGSRSCSILLRHPAAGASIDIVKPGAPDVSRPQVEPSVCVTASNQCSIVDSMRSVEATPFDG